MNDHSKILDAGIIKLAAYLIHTARIFSSACAESTHIHKYNSSLSIDYLLCRNAQPTRSTQ